MSLEENYFSWLYFINLPTLREVFVEAIESIRDHIGDSVTVCSKIYSGIFLDRNKDSLSLLNAGGRYPDAPLIILIPMNVRMQFEIEP